MTKRINYIVVLLFLPLFIMAQSKSDIAADYLSKAAHYFKPSQGIQLSFLMKSYDDNDQLQYEFNGAIKIKGERFLLQTDEMEVWYDGKNQYTYLKSTNEVTIAEPTQEELQTLNPYYFLNSYEENFRCSLDDEKTDEKYKIILKSKSKMFFFNDIILYLAKQNYVPLNIVLKSETQNLNNEVIITKYLLNQKYDDSIFVYNNNHPNAVIVDLR